jgi:hypothetical protein
MSLMDKDVVLTNREAIQYLKIYKPTEPDKNMAKAHEL